MTRQTTSAKNKHASASNLTRKVHEEIPRFRKSSYKKSDVDEVTERLMAPTIETVRKYHVDFADYPTCSKLGKDDHAQPRDNETKVQFSEENDDAYSDSFASDSQS